MRYVSFFLLISFFVSCKNETIQKEEPIPVVPYSAASYTMTVTLNWQSPQFAVPAGVHVTALIGMIHAKDTMLWTFGKLASKGLEDVAEIGNTVNMNVELDAILAANKALSKFNISPPGATGTVSADFDFNTNFPCISFASMIAPSPDWFMGLHDINLFENNKWVSDTTINMMVYDAGTEDGDVFGYDNPATNPQQNIAFLTPANASVLANGNITIAAIGTVRFLKK
jgi:hypothetical protein